MTTLPPLSRADASLSSLAAAPSTAASALGRPASGWFDGIGSAGSTGLRAEVEPQARGLSAAQHAERVLLHLLDQA